MSPSVFWKDKKSHSIKYSTKDECDEKSSLVCIFFPFVAHAFGGEKKVKFILICVLYPIRFQTNWHEFMTHYDTVIL